MKTKRLSLLLGFFLFAGCGSGGCGGSQPEKGKVAFANATFAHKLPRQTMVYVRLQGVSTLKDRLVQPAHLRDARSVQDKINQGYQAILAMLGQNNPYGLSEVTLSKVITDLESIHLAVVARTVGAEDGPAARFRPPEPMVFVQMSSADSVDQLLKALGARAPVKELHGVKVHDLKGIPLKPVEALYVMDGKVMVFGSEAMLGQWLAGQNAPEQESLAAVPAFRKAHQELAENSDLFVYVSITELRAEMLRDVDSRPLPAEVKERRRKAITNAPFQEIGSVGGSLAVDGSLVMRAYAAPGKQLPDFIVRTSVRKKLLQRIPAEALFAYVVGYDGGKKTRKDFSNWLKEELARGGSGEALGIPAPVTQLLTKNLDRLEEDVVVIAREFWVAALPVKSEMALCAAPDAHGRWGLAMFFDYEDKRQAEKLRSEIFEVGRRHNLPWQEETYQGVTIRYLDLEKLARQKGTKPLPPEVAENVQLKVGYAMSDEFMLAGSVETIKFALKPSGKTLADVISYRGIDAENALVFTFQPGRFLHHPPRIKPLEKFTSLLAHQVPEGASYSVTVTLEKEQATVRCNIPFTSLISWVALDIQDWMRMLR